MHALHQYAIHQRCRDDALPGMIKTACLKCKISPWWLRWGGRTNTNNDLGQKQRKGSKRTERSAFIGNEYVNVIMTLKLGFHLYPCYWEENENPSPVWSDIITARWKGKQLFILLVDTGIRYLEKVLWCQISPGNVVVVGGGLGGLEGGMHSQFYLRHFQPFIMRGCVGLTAQGGLYACEDYCQYTPTKQLWKANNCLKVNNNAMLSQQGGA